MSEQVIHIGNVVEVADGEVAVQIERGTACSHCESKKACLIMGKTEQTIRVKDKNYQNYSVGEQVKVSMNTSLGMKAIMLAYVLPLLILMLSLAVGFNYFPSELLQIAVALIPTVLYYITLYKFRRRIERNFTFFVSKL